MFRKNLMFVLLSLFATIAFAENHADKYEGKGVEMKATSLIPAPEGLRSSGGLPALSPKMNWGANPVGEVRANDLEFLGAVINSEEDFDYGIYSIDASNVIAELEPVYESTYFRQGAGCLVDDRYYWYSIMSSGSLVMSIAYYTFDASTWQQLDRHVLSTTMANFVTAAAYDANADKMYAISFNSDQSSHVINEVDIETGALTPLADIGMKYTYYTLSVDDDGNLYTIAGDGGLYRISLEDGGLTLIGYVDGNDELSFKPSYLQSAVYDEVSNKIYWAAFNTYDSFLAEVDITTGAMKQVATFPHHEEVLGLSMNRIPAATAPAALADFAVDFTDNGGMTGIISCTAPAKTYDGGNLSGDVTIEYRVDGETVHTATVAAGARCEYTYTFTEGSHKVYAYVTNAEGEQGPINRLRIYAGVDVPGAVGNLKLEISESGMATLTWNAPSTGLNNGYYNPDELTYTITRNPGNNLVAEGHTGNTFTEQLGEIIGNYYYNVTAYTNAGEGGTEQSNAVVYGTHYTVPYLENFEDMSVMDIFTIVDANSDQFYWFYERNDNTKNSYVYYTANNQTYLPANDWLITPPIRLEQGKVYELSFDSWVYDRSYPESLRVTMGTTNNPATQTNILLDLPSLTNSESMKRYTTVTVEQTGDYYFGFQVYSAEDMWDLYLDNISIEELGDLNAPQVVNNLKVTPGEKAALQATVSFNAPNLNFAGTPLASIDRIEIYKGTAEEPAHTINGATPGQSYTWTDNAAVQGFNAYTVIAYNASGRGARAQIEQMVGVDVPGQVRNLKITPTSASSAHLAWEAPSETGANGGYVPAEDVRYTIYRTDEHTRFEKIADNISALEFDDKAVDIIYHYQIEVQYDIVASTVGGDGEALVTSVIMGRPYPLPFAESLAGMQLHVEPWENRIISGKASWKATTDDLTLTVEPQDEDGGMFSFYSDQDNGAEELLITPYVSVSSAIEPVFSFWFYHDPNFEGQEQKVTMELMKEDGTLIPLKEVPLTSGDLWEWTYYSVPLSDYKDLSSFRIAMHGYSEAGGAQMLVDNLRIEDNCAYDLMLQSLSVPSNVQMGNQATITATVANLGSEVAEGFSLELYKDDVLFMTQEANRFAKINPGSALTFTFRFDVNAWDCGKTSAYAVKVVYAPDQKPDNNMSAAQNMSVAMSGFEGVDDLDGTLMDGVVQLNWTAVETSSESMESQIVTDGAEDYEDFSIAGFGEWTLYDGDGIDNTYTVKDVPDYPNKYRGMAWQIWTPAELGLAGTWNPHGGAKSFISWAAVDGNGSPNDDWLISPRIKGGTDLDFYAAQGTNVYGPEKLQIMVSYSNNDPANFVKLKDVDVNGFGEWEHVACTLPEGAQYFAIRYVSQMNFCVMVDDITYVTSDGTLPQVVGYNVYRNGVKITETPITETTFTESDPQLATLEYAVSAVYEHGESAVSNIVSFRTNGIDELLASSTKVWSESRNIWIGTENETFVEVYTVAGQKLAGETVDGTWSLHVDMPGVYIVKAGNKMCKVMVR